MKKPEMMYEPEYWAIDRKVEQSMNVVKLRILKCMSDVTSKRKNRTFQRVY